MKFGCVLEFLLNFCFLRVRHYWGNFEESKDEIFFIDVWFIISFHSFEILCFFFFSFYALDKLYVFWKEIQDLNNNLYKFYKMDRKISIENEKKDSIMV